MRNEQNETQEQEEREREQTSVIAHTLYQYINILYKANQFCTTRHYIYRNVLIMGCPRDQENSSISHHATAADRIRTENSFLSIRKK